MHINEAAHIIGSLGGRPIKYHRKPWSYWSTSGQVPFSGTAYQTEDLLFFYTDETGLNNYTTES